MELSVEKVLEAERNFLANHEGELDFPVKAMKEELEPVFQKWGWRESKGEVRSILLQHSEANGDFVMSSPFIRAVRQCYPQAYITLMVYPACQELAEACPYVDEVFVRPGYKGQELTWREGLEELLKLLPPFLSRRYDLGFTWNEARGAWDRLWLYWAGVRERIGFGPYVIEGATMKEEARHWHALLTLALPRDRGAALRDSEKCLRLLEAFTKQPVSDRNVEVWTNPADERAAAPFLQRLKVRGMRRIYAVMPGVSEARRQWPVERWQELLEAILSREPQTGLVILGGPKEVELAEGLAASLSENFNGRVISAAGKLTFRGTAALLKGCSKYLGNDTGALHLAVAQQVPILVPYAYALDIGLRSLSMPVRFAPWGVPAVQVFPKEHRDDCRDLDGPGCAREDEAHCILGITVETMLYAYEALEKQIAAGAEKPIRFC